jgi:hypothetical protein
MMAEGLCINAILTLGVPSYIVTLNTQIQNITIHVQHTANENASHASCNPETVLKSDDIQRLTLRLASSPSNQFKCLVDNKRLLTGITYHFQSTLMHLNFASY